MLTWLCISVVVAFVLMAAHIQGAKWGWQAAGAAAFVLAFGVFLIELVKESR